MNRVAAFTMNVNVYINGQQIFPSYSNADFTIKSTGVQLLLTIPAINAQVMFKYIQFSITLPDSLFHGNTEGQCGTSDNNMENDCRSPNGQIAPCPEMAQEWQIPDDKKPYCKPQPTGPPPTPEPTTICLPEQAAVCDILISSVFEPCHEVIPPQAFLEACKYDVCNMQTKSIGCSSLEAYATMCTNHGVCIDWRPSTNGLCEYKCPSTKIYYACGPAIQPTCNSRYNDIYVQPCQGVHRSQNVTCDEVGEGCFCPEGNVLFNTYSDTCVSSCGCTGPDGNPKKPGDSWLSDCLECNCSADTVSVLCSPVECQIQENVSCNIGEVLVTETVGCCQSEKCVCDVSQCPEPEPCPRGTQLVVKMSKESCCPIYIYEKKPVCVYNNTEYQPGAIWSPPNNRCLTYECKQNGSQFKPVPSRVQCPVFNPANCIPGTETTDANGCCETCTPSVCALQKNTTFLQIDGCKSVKPVELSACGGSCGTYSMYSAMKNGLMHSCSCCLEMSTSERKVEMVCSNGKKTTQTYIYIEQCGCSVTECEDTST
ncbi:hypothetical protein UPYG_G00272340 [Umbra pygmaea]|uniref:Intestinal mucin-like protein n=1 Tax=Umbra pygmaea TaxID=75934 RepID=A0ABD0WB19_UMBPY